ncbi:YD repeat-containing protein [Clostridium cavendishii DSM 21758]|uniref:YD repeat-containing protein n=1 Tax=Clostridium cavendishii DSM 21758 TaxID=1121302 RepID=A0A1M6I1V8_9CLOT|nr:RHS repeat domain-containing protein [Clostridium cavendishii]SHJ28441.1 YD repeat-containing protein [Clostridium cavendishii DSM 21758]
MRNIKKSIVGLLIMSIVIAATSVYAYGTTYKYDDLDRLIEVCNDDGSRIIYTYDEAGNITSIESIPPQVELKEILFDKQIYNVDSGGEGSIIVTALYSDGSKKDVTNKAVYMSSNPEIAIVTNEGKIEKRRIGQTTVTASYFGVKSNCIINVLDGTTQISLN